MNACDTRDTSRARVTHTH